jgi:small GTP-binding protein
MGNCNCTNKQEIQNVNIVILSESNTNTIHNQIPKVSSNSISKFMNDSQYIQNPVNVISKNLTSITTANSQTNRMDNNNGDDEDSFNRRKSELISDKELQVVKEETVVTRKNSNESLINKIRRKSTSINCHKNYDIYTIQKLLSGKAIAIEIKIVLCGDALVGKSSIANRYVEKKYDSFYSISFFIEKHSVQIQLNDVLYNLLIYVTIGNEKYRLKNEEAIRNSDVVLFIFDLSQKKSLNSIVKLYEKINDIKNPNIYFVGNKSDLRERRIPSNKINEYCQSKLIKYFEISAKTNTNIDNMFLKIIDNFHFNTKN